MVGLLPNHRDTRSHVRPSNELTANDRTEDDDERNERRDDEDEREDVLEDEDDERESDALLLWGV